jgi:uncharacterized protein YbbC (DUF1343 family)
LPAIGAGLLLGKSTVDPRAAVRSHGRPPLRAGVLTGIDVLVRDGFRPLRGKRIGLVTNQTGVTRDGTPTIDVLAQAEGVNLATLFAPEHGLRGTTAAGMSVGSARDQRTGLPVYSLYGRTREPTARMLRGLNAIVFDMQDIGSRSYTYISTLGRCMDACARHELPIIVLDRPNLLGGNRVEGNILDPRFRSFVGPYAIAYCHGLTIGELARMISGRGWIAGGRKCALSVVRMDGYRRDLPFKHTGLPWVPTSPNVPYARTPVFYAATGIVGELPTLSIGIGTDRPFELAGAPGLDGHALAAVLNRRGLPGYSFEPASWTPTKGVHAQRSCTGVRIGLTDANRAELTRLNFELMDAVRKITPDRRFFGVDAEMDHMFDLSCGTDRVRRAFIEGRSAAEIWREWNTGSVLFRRKLQK